VRKVICSLLACLFILGTVLAQSKAIGTKSKTGSQTKKKAAQTKVTDTATIAPDATHEARVAYYRKVQNIYVNNYLSQPLHKDTEKDWILAFGGMLNVGFTSDLAKDRLHYAFADIGSRSATFQESLLELLYTIYPDDFQEDINHLLFETNDPKTFALCVEYLMRDSIYEIDKSYFQNLLDQKRRSDPNNFVYQVLEQRLQNNDYEGTPPLGDLLKFEFVKGNVVLFSIQSSNRNYPGLILIRKADGKFLRNPDNSLFHVAQVARSITNLPFYFNSGNTPQGIYRIGGIESSKTEFIGPTERIKLLMPEEAKLSMFNPRIKDTTIYWNSLFYKNLMPLSWRKYEPFYEAFYAGMSGRKGIKAHGTTINPEYYAGKPWYPLTLFTGSLSTKELWDEKTGKRIESDQYKLIQALKKSGKPEGFLIVVDIDNQDKPVDISQVDKLIESLESGL